MEPFHAGDNQGTSFDEECSSSISQAFGTTGDEDSNENAIGAKNTSIAAAASVAHGNATDDDATDAIFNSDHYKFQTQPQEFDGDDRKPSADVHVGTQSRADVTHEDAKCPPSLKPSPITHSPSPQALKSPSSQTSRMNADTTGTNSHGFAEELSTLNHHPSQPPCNDAMGEGTDSLLQKWEESGYVMEFVSSQGGTPWLEARQGHLTGTTAKNAIHVTKPEVLSYP